jgi:hypothetical protein
LAGIVIDGEGDDLVLVLQPDVERVRHLLPSSVAVTGDRIRPILQQRSQGV